MAMLAVLALAPVDSHERVRTKDSVFYTCRLFYIRLSYIPCFLLGQAVSLVFRGIYPCSLEVLRWLHK